jgi:hypothetical protein
MRLHLFEKASYLKDRIKLEQKGENLIALKVNGRFEVLFYYKGHRLHYSCDCKDGSLGQICSHSIAGILWIAENIDIIRITKNG